MPSPQPQSWFCCCCSLNLAEFICQSSEGFVGVFKVFCIQNHLWVPGQLFLFPCRCLFFSCLVALAVMSRTLLTWNSGRNHLRVVPNPRENVFKSFDNVSLRFVTYGFLDLFLNCFIFIYFDRVSCKAGTWTHNVATLGSQACPTMLALYSAGAETPGSVRASQASY